MKKWLFLAVLLLIAGCGQTQNLTTSVPDTRPVLYWEGRVVSTLEVFSSKIIYCTGNISIESGGSLTLDYVTLYMSCESTSQYGIFVNSGGTLTITNESILTAVKTAEGYYAFWYKPTSRGSIYASKIYYTFTGEGAFQESGLYVESDSFRIVGSTLSYSKGDGIYFHPPEAVSNASIAILNSVFEENGADGIRLKGYGPPYQAELKPVAFAIQNCTVKNNGRNTQMEDGCGILIDYGAGEVSGCEIRDNRYCGLEPDFKSDARIFNNTITGNGHDGIFLHEGSQGIISGNTIHNSGHNGISLDNIFVTWGNTAEVYDNSIEGSGTNGILVSDNDASTIYIHNNTISRSGQNGIATENSSSEVVIRQNIITYNTDNGVIVGNNSLADLGNLGDSSSLNDGGNYILNNPQTNLCNFSSQEVKAENNYWGSNSASVIQGHIYDQVQNASKGRVDFIPFLTLPSIYF